MLTLLEGQTAAAAASPSYQEPTPPAPFLPLELAAVELDRAVSAMRYSQEAVLAARDALKAAETAWTRARDAVACAQKQLSRSAAGDFECNIL